MPKYENTSKTPLKVLTATGIITIAPSQVVELSTGVALRGAPYLKEVKESQTQQLLVEAPLPIEEKKVEEVVEEEAPTVKIDVDGDGEADIEVKGEVLEEEESEDSAETKVEEEASKPKPRSRKRR